MMRRIKFAQLLPEERQTWEEAASAKYNAELLSGGTTGTTTTSTAEIKGSLTTCTFCGAFHLSPPKKETGTEGLSDLMLLHKAKSVWTRRGRKDKRL